MVVRAHSSGPEEEEPMDARAFRRTLTNNKNYNRRVSGDEGVLEQMAEAGISAVNKGSFTRYDPGVVCISLR
jgi:hypothetical protein